MLYRLLLILLLAASANFAHAAEAPALSPASPEATFPIHEFRLSGNTLLANELLIEKLASLHGENRTLKDLAAARDVVIAKYREAGYYLVAVGLPASIAADGVITLQIVEMTLGTVRLNGNQRYSDANLRRQLPGLVEGTAPNVTELTREIFIANDNPARKLSLDFTPPGNGVVDATVKVEESSPLSFGATLDSSGIRETGRTRLILTASHANVFDRSHVMTFGYRTSPAYPENVKVAELGYDIPVPELAGRVQMSAKYADVDAGRVLNAFEVSGKYSQTRIGYLYDLKRQDASRHSLEIGLADKRYRPIVQFGGTNLVTDISARPLSFGYRYANQTAERALAFDLTYFRNLRFGDDNDDATYNSSRFTASAGWEKYRANASFQRHITGDWVVRVRGVVQYAHEPLIDIEAMYVGGMDSVRGLVEGELLGDRGYFTSGELYTPLLFSAHRLLAFIDNGSVTRLNPQPGEIAGDSATTWGLGWRFSVHKRADFALDWAKVKSGTSLTPSGDSAWNFRLIARF